VLTLKQLFASSGLESGAALVRNFGLQPLSVASVSAAFERQRQAFFVRLISPKLLQSDQVRFFDDLMRLADSPLAQVSQADVTALAGYLEERGVYLRYVSKDLRRAVIFGDVPSLVSVPAAPLNDGNFTTFQDTSSGATKVGTGTVALGTVIVALVVNGPAVAAAGGEVALIIGAGVVALGAGFLVGWGINELIQGDKPTPPPRQPSSDNLDSPNDLGDENGGDIEIPNAIALGSPDNGIDVSGMVDQLASGVMEDIMSSIPLGWDSDSGTALPGIGDFDGGDGGGDGTGLGGDVGFG
jgi:hypothetical protein